jgi:hypothetical protein
MWIHLKIQPYPTEPATCAQHMYVYIQVKQMLVPLPKMIQDQKDISGTTPEVEEMLEHAISQESPNMA